MEHLLGLPPDGSAHGPAIDHLIGLVHWLMLVLFVGWGVFFVATLIRYRKSRQPKANYTGVKSHISSYLEAGVLVVEVILLVGFSIPLWSKRVDDFPAKENATVVRIVAEQFAWNVHYPGPDGKFGRTSINLIDSDNPLGLDRTDPDAKDDITTINQLNLPVGRPVIIYLSSKDVVHSFNLPAFRVKQDVIPGQMIPLWFTPTKTTDQIREEVTSTYSVTDLMRKVHTVKLPPGSMLTLQRGESKDDMMSMQDVTDSTGGTIISKGDFLTKDNIAKLDAAGKMQIAARPAAHLDKFVTAQECKGPDGTVAVGRDETLSEDAVTKIVEAGIHEVSIRPAANMDLFVTMAAYQDKSGNAIAAKGDPITDDMISKLADAGIREISVAPATPTEIACAQLCGLGHYRMRGYVTVQTPDDFQTWYDAQEAAVNPPAAPDTTHAAPADSTAHATTSGTPQ